MEPVGLLATAALGILTGVTGVISHITQLAEI